MHALFSLGSRGIGIGLTACVGAGATALFVSFGSDSNASASGSGSDTCSTEFAGLDDERRSQLYKPKFPYPQWDDNWYSRTERHSIPLNKIIRLKFQSHIR